MRLLTSLSALTLRTFEENIVSGFCNHFESVENNVPCTDISHANAWAIALGKLHVRVIVCYRTSFSKITPLETDCIPHQVD